MIRREEELFNHPLEAQIVLEDAKRDLEENEAGFELAKKHVLYFWGSVAILILFLVIGLGTESSLLLTLDGILAMIAAIALAVLTRKIYNISGGTDDFRNMIKRYTIGAWRVVPIFPLDIIVGIYVAAFGLFAFIFLPKFMLSYRKKTLTKDIELAQDYIRRHPMV